MVSYTGFLLNLESQFILIDYFKNLQSKLNLNDDWQIKCHHVTLNMGSIPLSKIKFIEDEFNFKIVGIGLSEKACCLKVEILNDKDFVFQSKFQHVTLAHNVTNNGKPFHSNECTIKELSFDDELKNIILTTNLFEFDSKSKKIDYE